MKIILIVSLFFTSALNHVYSQNSVEISYDILFNRESFDESLDKNYETKLMKEMILSSEQYLHFTLICNGENYVFERNEVVFQDENSLLKAVVKSINNGIYFGNLRSNSFLKVVNFNNINYLIPNRNIDWEVKNETKVIQGFTCYKAVRKSLNNEIITAWFTPELPFKVGPNEAINLPGLVLELNYLKYNLVAKKIKFEINDEKLSKSLKIDGIRVSEEEFNTIVLKARKDI